MYKTDFNIYSNILYCLGMADERKAILNEKLACSDLFKETGRPDYPASVEVPFSNKRQDLPAPAMVPSNYQYTCNVMKFNIANMKPAKGIRQLHLSADGTLYLSEKSKINRIIPSNVIKQVTISNLSDQFMVISVDPEHTTDKKAFTKAGDMIISLVGEANIFEFLTKYKNIKKDLEIDICKAGQVTVIGPKQKEQVIVYENGSTPGHRLNPQKQLVITSVKIALC